MLVSLFFLLLGCESSTAPSKVEVNGCGPQVKNYEKEVLRYTGEMKKKNLTKAQRQEFQNSFEYLRRLLHEQEKDGKLSETCLKKVKALTLQADLSDPINKHDIKVRKNTTK